jgi:hypothetical protein
MMDSMFSVIQTGLTVLGTLGGAWAGSHLNRGAEERQWRRNRRVESYTDILMACTVVADESDRAFFEEPGTADAFSQNSVVIEKVREMHRASTRASLLLSEKMVSYLNPLITHCGNLAKKSTADEKPDIDQWRKARTSDLAECFSAFAQNARAEIMSADHITWRLALGRGWITSLFHQQSQAAHTL